MKYYIIAGEASGDLHGSNLMKGIYAEDPQADIRFWGGALMDAVYHAHQQGTGLVQDYNAGAVIGFSQIILHLGAYANRLRRCGEDILRFAPDVVILIDYPGFNFRVAEFAHKRGLKVFYYIAPKVWASRENRVKKLKKYVDKLFIVFPFEIPYFTRKGVDFIYKGNPLIDAIDQSEALRESREAFLEVVAGAPSRSMEDYAPWLQGREEYMRVVFGQTYGVMRHARAAVINSGTASLEACLIGTPQVVAYAGADFNFNVGKQIIRIDSISLGNLILGRMAFRELLQFYFTPDNVFHEIVRLLEDTEYRQRMLDDYREIREALGSSGASAAVARAMISQL